MSYHQPAVSTLKRLRPLAQFSDDQLQQLANQLQVLSARKREKLIELGCTDEYSLFVLEGEVRLVARDGKSRDLHITADQELTPIAQLRPCMYDVVANSALQYLKIDRQKLAEFAQHSESSTDDPK